uniref:Odorant binding protein 7 n=1 Tax=Subpsaltria yangi TaxID=1195109 RepID=A0A385IUP1_9HEMI|nr:odorant binding protein 7 [Subpsaltria yangi]
MAKLITTLAVVALAGFAAAQSDKTKFMETLNKCQSQFNVDPSELELMKNKEAPTSDKGKCLIACIMEEGGIIKDGKYSLDGSMAFAEATFSGNADNFAVAKDTALKCQGEAEAANAANKCDLALEITKCLTKYASSLSGAF